MNVPPDSEQPDANSRQVPSQNQVNAETETVRESSERLLQEHLRQYKANRNELFPLYEDSSQEQKTRDIMYRLPLRYRDLFYRIRTNEELT